MGFFSSMAHSRYGKEIAPEWKIFAKKTIELKIKLDRPSIISANQSFHTS
jgi:hypothetical protein